MLEGLGVRIVEEPEAASDLIDPGKVTSGAHNITFDGVTICHSDCTSSKHKDTIPLVSNRINDFATLPERSGKSRLQHST